MEVGGAICVQKSPLRQQRGGSVCHAIMRRAFAAYRRLNRLRQVAAIIRRGTRLALQAEDLRLPLLRRCLLVERQREYQS